MTNHHPAKQRRFAVEVVDQLRAQGFQAFWAGGCVRDQLLQRRPKDFDVATNAVPEEIRRVFGRRRTLAIGAAFGVITVLGLPEAGQVEVTTFRRDAEYRDGRHPDRVEFSSPEEDAQRRDFTINGMFYDPLAEQVIDYVGGQEDLRAGIVRAIGDPQARFREDKLRMLRAVRFASIFDFELEAATLAAIQEMAAEVTVVSAERIAGEIEIMLEEHGRARAVRLLRETGLLAAVLPELVESGEWRVESEEAPVSREPVGERERQWTRTIALFDSLNEPTFALALAVLLQGMERPALAAEIGLRLAIGEETFGASRLAADESPGAGRGAADALVAVAAAADSRGDWRVAGVRRCAGRRRRVRPDRVDLLSHAAGAPAGGIESAAASYRR